jgi:alpha-mannosidase
MRGPTEGVMPPVGSFLSIDPSNVLLLNMKRADNGNGIIIRLAETAGRRTQTTVNTQFTRFRQVLITNPVEEDQEEVHCNDCRISLGMEPFEIKTVRLVQ